MENYFCTLDTVKDKLSQYGIAMVPNILTQEECELMKEGAWDWLEYVTTDCPIPMDRTNPASWKTFKELYPKHSMLIQQWSIGHAQFIWNLRTNPKILHVFERIWNTPAEDLLVSLFWCIISFSTRTNWIWLVVSRPK
jgi:phenylpropionate dioxygenase-like ring-hydroxylating dioxygenase large terminal subunit